MELDGPITTMRRMVGVCAVAFGLLVATATASPQGIVTAKSSALLGTSRIGAHGDSIATGSARAFLFTNRVSATANTIRVYVARNHRAHAFTLGIYSSRSGRPATLLTSGSTRAAKAGRWATVHVHSVGLRAGRSYWIAVLARHARLYVRDRVTRECRSAVARQHRLRGLPSRWRTGAWRHACEISAQVRGGRAAPPPTRPTPPVPPPSPPSPPAPPAGPIGLTPPPIVCTATATPSTFGSVVSGAAAGQTVCLASGNYGTWGGTNKAITIAPAPGASPTMQVNFGSGDTGFTMLEIGGLSGQISAGASNITIEFSAFTDTLVVDGLSNADVVLNADTFKDISDPGCNGQPARIHVVNSSGPTGFTVENSLFSGGDTDGIQTGSPLTILNNVFTDLRSSSSDCNHTDSIQLYGGNNVVASGNLFDNDYDGLVAFDGTAGNTITDNVCYNIDRGSCITLYSDDGSVVNHNTAGPGMNLLEVDRKSGDPAGTGTVFENNVGDFTQANGSTLQTDTNNLFPSAHSPNIAGRPTFVGGTSPTTWAGYELTPTSAGHGAATDKSAVGIRASAAGPPAW
jgi:hypothetical protein